jgi:Concanavalin A-like lectin/glucanases superfamily
MEAWVNYSGSNVTILDKGDYDFLWSINPNINSSQMGFYTKNTGTWSYSTGIVPQNTWTHVAITLNAGTLTFYINGVASGTASVTFSQDNQPMNIGRQQPTACVCNYFNGTMDELRLWNVVRPPAQILTNMNSTIPTNSAGLVAYYKFDESTGTTTADATSNGNNGTLVNIPTWQVPSTSPVNRVVWSPGGATTPTIVASNVGTYTATVTNGYGCTNSGSITINSVSPIPTSQANTSIATGGSLSLTATGCSGSSGTYILKWYKASDNSLITMPISPSTTTNYYAKCENTFNSTTCLSPASANVIVYVGNIVNSLIAGDWENTNTWTPSRIPLPTDNVIINNHTVTITSNSANTKRVDLKNGGVLKYFNTAAKLKVGF